MAKFTISIEDGDATNSKGIIVNSVSDPDIDLVAITQNELSPEEIEALKLTPAQQLGVNLTMAIKMFKEFHSEEENDEKGSSEECGENCNCES